MLLPGISVRSRHAGNSESSNTVSTTAARSRTSPGAWTTPNVSLTVEKSLGTVLVARCPAMVNSAVKELKDSQTSRQGQTF